MNNSDSSLRKFFYKTRNQLWTNNTLVLLICIFIAFIFWLLSSLSKNYTTDLAIAAQYINRPQDKVVVNELPQQLQMRVSNTGWQLLRESLSLDELYVAIDVDRFSESEVMYTNANLEYFENQLPTGYQVTQVNPSVINFAFDKRVSKVIPVRLNSLVTLDPLYGFSDSISITPDSVHISGPAVVLDSIQEVETQPLRLERIDRSQTGTLKLKKKHAAVVNYEQESVKYDINIEPYTETKIEVPIKIINPPRQNIMLLNKTATVSFQLPLDQFEMVQSEDFQQQFNVVADFAQVDSISNEVTLQLIGQPGFIKKVQLNPKQVNFLFVKEQ